MPVEDEYEPEASSKSFSKKRNHNHRLLERYNENLVEHLEKLPSNPKNVTRTELIEFYDTIHGKFLFLPTTKKHPKYNILYEATKYHLPQLSTKQVKSIVIAILPSKSVMYDELGETIIDALLKRAQYLPFDQIVFVDFMLNKYYNGTDLSNSYKILQLRLQTLFLSRVEDELDEIDSLEEAIKLVSYCHNNTEIIPSKIINLLTTTLLLADDDLFDISDITTVLIFLANLGKLNEHVEKLLRKMISLWNQLPVSAKDAQVLLKVLAAKNSKKKIDKLFFESSEFIQHCVNVVIEQNDKSLTFSVQNSLNKMVTFFIGILFNHHINI